jgi:hypothetical protein
MHRDYTKKSQTKSVLGFLLLFLYVIPVGALPGTQFAPINYIFIIIGLYLLLNINSLKYKLSQPVIIIILSSFLYLLLSYYLDYYKTGAEYHTIVNSYRFFLTIFFFLSINDKNTLYFLLKSFTYLILFSTIFGILIHFLGEPFATLRMTILRGGELVDYVGKGDRIVGFTNKIFHFGYFLAPLPALLLTLYKVEGKKMYLYMLLIAYIGIVLNGERSALLFASLTLLYLLHRWFHVQIGFLIILGIFGSFFLVESLINIDNVLLNRVVSQTREGEAEFRLSRQLAGILSVFESPFIGSVKDTYHNIFYSWYGKIPRSSHNTYVNIGMRGGIIGWFLFYLFGKNVIKIIKVFKSKYQRTRIGKDLYLGIIVSFIGVLSVGLTHNSGIFTEEKITSIILCFILSFALINYNKKNPIKDNI